VILLHVSFRSLPEGINAVLAKHADVLFDSVSTLTGPVQTGSLKALAVSGKNRVPAVPDVPTLSESGVVSGYDVTSWYGVPGPPPGMPAPVVGTLSKTLSEIIDDERVRQRLVAICVVVKGSTAAEFGDLLAGYKRWNAVRKATGIAQQSLA
jgi:tripartite-type tricarboxylate transporter receptor subunit TctC